MLNVKGFGKFLEDKTPRRKVKIKKPKAKASSAWEAPQGKYTKAERAFWDLPKERRIKIRNSGKYADVAAWYAAKQARRQESQAASVPRLRIVQQGNVKPKPPTNPYAVLLTPYVIVPQEADGKVVIADAGTIVRLMDQTTLYRNYVSPITRRGDELLVQYGNKDKLNIGWITNKSDPRHFKPTKGPTFLVQTKDEKLLSAWDQLRLAVARYRKGESARWLGSWLTEHGEKHKLLLREVTRFLGGKPIKNEPFAQRALRLLSLIIHSEIETMPEKVTPKKGKKSSKKVAKETSEAKSSKKSGKKKSGGGSATKPAKAAKSRGEFTVRSNEYNDHVIRRLSKENPRKEGTQGYKLWAKLKKGMTVAEFMKVGGSRAVVRKYLDNGWVRLASAE